MYALRSHESEIQAQIVSEVLFHVQVPFHQVAALRVGFNVALPQTGRGCLSDVAAEQHIWWGVSVENRKHGFPRIADLQASPAAIRFLSVEPLLEDLGTVSLDGISWVIVGGESGPGARPMKEDWVLSIRDQCMRAKVPFFFKQWGGVRKKEAGRTLLGRTFNEFPKRVKNRPLPLSVRLRHVSRIEGADLVQITAD
jgi:protein gp37